MTAAAGNLVTHLWAVHSVNNKEWIKSRIRANGKAEKPIRVHPKIKRKHAFKSHILTKKTKKQKRNLTHFGLIAKVDENNVKALLALK